MQSDDGCGDHRLLSGIDIVSIDSVERRLNENDNFAKRLFTESERNYCEGKPNPAQHYAARWTAKEAFVKALALTKPNLSFRSIEVIREPTGTRLSLGEDACLLLDQSLSRYGDGATVADSNVSLAHDRSLGIAVGQVIVLVRVSPNRSG